MGKETLGRIINVIGEPVDEQGPVSAPLASLVHPMAPVMACTHRKDCRGSTLHAMQAWATLMHQGCIARML